MDSEKNDFKNPFGWINDSKNTYVSSHSDDLLDFGVANSFFTPPKSILSNLQISSKDHNFEYTYFDHSKFDNSSLKYISTVFNPSNISMLGITNTAGAKGGLNLIAMFLAKTEGIVLTTKPGYPIFEYLCEYYNIKTKVLYLDGDGNITSTILKLPDHVLKRTKAILINYPNNPTGAILSKSDLEKIISVCLKNNILLINDATYSSIVMKPESRISLFNISNSEQCCIEIHSLSKAFQIPGLRLGFILAEKRLISILKKIEVNISSGQPKILLDAVYDSLETPDYVELLSSKVKERFLRLSVILSRHGFVFEIPHATLFILTNTPMFIGNYFIKDSQDCAQRLLTEYGIILTPWILNGEDKLRFSVCWPNGSSTEILNELDKRLKKASISWK